MSKKVVLVGTGFVGMSFIYSAVNQGIASEYVLIDILKEKTEGEALDIQDGLLTVDSPASIKAGTYNDCKDAVVVVITAGLAQKEGETRLDLVEKNTKIIESITAEIENSGFNGIYLIASNPVDIMTRVVMDNVKASHKRVVGSGTLLDSNRLRYAMATKLNVPANNVDLMIIGEHGDTSVPLYSIGKVQGHPIYDLIKQGKLTTKDLEDVYLEARNAAYKIISAKKATYYGIGMSLAKIVKAIIRDERLIMPLSAKLNGEYGQNDVVVPIPVIIGKNGIEKVLEYPISNAEKELLNKSCETLNTYYKK